MPSWSAIRRCSPPAADQPLPGGVELAGEECVEPSWSSSGGGQVVVAEPLGQGERLLVRPGGARRGHRRPARRRRAARARRRPTRRRRCGGARPPPRPAGRPAPGPRAGRVIASPDSPCPSSHGSSRARASSTRRRRAAARPPRPGPSAIRVVPARPEQQAAGVRRQVGADGSARGGVGRSGHHRQQPARPPPAGQRRGEAAPRARRGRWPRPSGPPPAGRRLGVQPGPPQPPVGAGQADARGGAHRGQVPGQPLAGRLLLAALAQPLQRRRRAPARASGSAARPRRCRRGRPGCARPARTATSGTSRSPSIGADRLRRVQGGAAGADRQPGQQGALGLAEQVVAPGDGGAQRALPVGRSTSPPARSRARGSPASRAEPAQQHLRRHGADPGGDELHGQRQPLEPADHLADGGACRRRRARTPDRPGGPGRRTAGRRRRPPLPDRPPGGRRGSQRPERDVVLPAQPQQAPAGQPAAACAGSWASSRASVGRAAGDLLEVVEQQQHVPCRPAGRRPGPAPGGDPRRDAHRGGDRAGHVRRVAHRCQVDQPDAVPLGRQLAAPRPAPAGSCRCRPAR